MGKTLNPDYEGSWQKILGELEISLEGNGFKTFVKPTELVGITGNTALISVSSVFTSAQIKGRFEPAIIQAIQVEFPEVTALNYTVQQAAGQTTDQIFEPEQTAPRTQTTRNTPGSPQAQGTIFQQPHLAQRYNFQSFVVGSSNRLAYAAAQLVAEKPGTDYNPLFLYGPAGVGKTHLMWAAYGAIASHNPNLQLLYITIEEFYKTFVDSVRKSEAFTTKYRNVDVLLIDDIQFIQKKETTQEEFFHTFNALHQANKQIVICSDRPPKEIAGLEERLRSRFEWGMVVDIQPPDLETRVAILQSKAEQKRFDLPLEVAEAIAQRISTNIRELEGAFNRLIMYCELHQEEPSLEMVDAIIEAVEDPGKRKPSPRLVLTETARYFGVTIEELTGKRRSRDIVVPRQVAMYLLRSEIELSLPQIGSHLGGRDHTTIMHGCKKLDILVAQKDPITRDISNVRERINSEVSVAA